MPASSGLASQALTARLALVARRRYLSEPVSMIVALKVSRSIMAAILLG